MARWFTVLLIALLLMSVFLPTYADVEDDEEPEAAGEGQAGIGEEEAEPPAVVSGMTIFPDYAEQHFPAGSTIEALIGMVNPNTQAFHVDFIRGMVRALAPPYPFVQNFSGAVYNTTVRPGTEATLLYRFVADPSIATQEYEMLIEVFYTSADNETYLATVHNATVYIDDAPTTYGFQLLSATVLLFGMIGGAGYGAWRFVKKNTRKSGPRARREEVRESSAAAGTEEAPKGRIDWDFISPEHASLVKGGPRKESPQRKESPNRKSPNRKSPSRKAE